MKKLLAILFAAIMVLRFAGCGNSEEKMKEILYSEKWIDVYEGSLKYEFLPGGVTDNSWTEWEFVEDGYIKTTSNYGITGTTTHIYKMVEKNGITVLEESREDYLLVRESDFEKARNTIEYPDHITKAVVKDNTGESKIVGSGELVILNRENTRKFNDTYGGAYVEIVGEIAEIGGKTKYTNYNHTVNAKVEVEGWEVEIANASFLTDFNVGDRVIITGYIFTADGTNVIIFAYNGKPTTIRHYSE